VILWIGIAAISLLVAAILLRAFYAAPVRAEASEQREFQVYEDQLAELRRDIAEGRIEADQAAAAEAEIVRRMLQAGMTSPIQPPAPARRGTAPLLAVAGSALAIVGAVILYVAVGAPGTPDFPADGSAGAMAAAQPGMAEHEGGEMSAAMARLEARLQEVPDDLEGWRLLARSRAATGEFAKAAQAFGRALALSDGDLKLRGDYAETLTHAAGGIVVPEAVRQFETIRAVQPDNPRARFFLAIARLQKGDAQGAIDDWMALLADATPGASWVPGVQNQIRATAQQYGIEVPDLAALPAAPPPTVAGAPVSQAPGPTSADIAAVREMPAADQMAMIRSMVDRLAERLTSEPQDVEGWLRLIRAYGVLGEQDAARDALAQALRHNPQAPRLLAAAEALKAPATPQATPLVRP